MTPPAEGLSIASGRTTKHEQRYHHSLKAAYQRHPAQIKPLHAKEDSPVFVNKLGERIKPNQFSKETMVPSPDQSEDTPMGLLLNQRHPDLAR